MPWMTVASPVDPGVNLRGSTFCGRWGGGVLQFYTCGFASMDPLDGPRVLQSSSLCTL